MVDSPVKQNKKNDTKFIILIALLAMVALIIAWHIVFPLLGMSIGITADVLAIAIGAIIMICVTSLLFFVFTGIGIIIFGVVVFIFALLASLLFPLLFPIIMPMLLVMLVIWLLVSRKPTRKSGRNSGDT